MMKRHVWIIGLVALAPQITLAAPPLIHIERGVYALESGEVYLDAFSISQSAFADHATLCDPPTVDEYLAAAQSAGFVASQAFEPVATPPEDACTWDAQVLEAEGVAGNNYYAGLGRTLPTDGFRFVYGGKDPRTTISALDANIHAFWGDEYKPSPRAGRCVEREERVHELRIVRADTPVYPRRDAKTRVKMTLKQGAEVKVLYEKNGWSFVAGKGAHGCQKNPEWDVFEDRGWVSSAALRR